ncbi:hypothetical protein M9458_016710, partial [Cirrhinus mrigala]
GLAAQEGTIERGDEVLSINGQTLKNVTHSDATAILRQARTMKQAVIVVSKNKDPEGKGGANANEEQRHRWANITDVSTAMAFMCNVNV